VTKCPHATTRHAAIRYGPQEPIVPDDDLLGRLEQVHDEADILAQRVEAAQAAAAKSHSGADQTGTVSTQIDEAGRLREVALDRSWRNTIDPKELGAAVQEAFGRAMSSRLETFGAALDAQEKVPPPPPRSPSGAQAELPRLLQQAATDDKGHGAALTEIASFLAEVNESLAQLDEQITAVTSATHAGRSKAGHVTATVTATGDLTGIRYDLRWLMNAHEFNIGRETVEAVRAAVRKAGQHSIDDAIARSPFGRLRAASQDPQEFIRRLRP
jgi:DNA-binding protein YbaB